MDSAKMTGGSDGAGISDMEVSPAADFPSFQKNLAALSGGTEPLRWTRPVCTGGEWISVGMVPDDPARIGVLVSLDSASGDGAIREIRFVSYDRLYADALQTAALCCRALTGETVTLHTPEAKETTLTLNGATLTAQHLTHEESSLVYDRIRLTPDSVPPKREEIREPGEEEEIYGFDSDITAAVLDERLARMTEAVLPEGYTLTLVHTGVDQGSLTRVYMLSNSSTGVIVYLNGKDEETATVSMIAVMDFTGDAPAVLGATMLMYAIAADQDEFENMAMSYLLIETPMWSELADLWPLLSRDGVCAFLQNMGEDEDDWVPAGFVCAAPGND